MLLILALWLATVAPLTTLGFGSDTDAWLVADVTDHIVAQGRYLRSRTSGFPLYELAVTPLVQLGNWHLSNLLALGSGLVLFLTVAALGRGGHYRHPTIVLVTLMFLPVIVKNSSVTMDYIPALALLLLAYRALVNERWGLTAVLIGVATGFRPSSLVFALPCAIYVWRHTRQVVPAVRLIGIAAVVGAVAFSPSLPNGPFGIVPTMPWMKGVYNAFRLFGLAQTLALALVGWVSRKTLTAVLRQATADPVVMFHLAVVVTWVALFAPLPDEPEYLLPLVPSVLWLLDRALSRRAIVTVCAIVLSYHVFSVEAGGTRRGARPMRLVAGPGFTVADIEDRRFKLSIREAATTWKGQAPTLLMEQALAVTTRNPAWILDSKVDEYRQRDGQMYVALRYYRADMVKRIVDNRVRIVVLKDREWEFHQPGRDTAWPFIDFVTRDELDRLLGRPIVGRPLS